MSDPTPFEQLMLEYINQARMDPQGEFDRFILSTSPLQTIDPDITRALDWFNVDLDLYQQQLEGLTAVAPLAWNGNLTDAARAHSQLMIDQDAQSHQLAGEASLGSRISAAGYTGWNALGENIYAYSESAAYGHAGFFIDWGIGPGGIQSPAGHRNNILKSTYTEVGIGVLEDNSGATTVGPYVVTQDFGYRSSYDVQFVGVCYDDNDSNSFYSIGEGRGGVTVTVAPAAGGSSFTTSQNAGGYAIEATAGINTVTFSGGGLGGSVSVDILFGTYDAVANNKENVKVDLVDGDTILSSADATLGNGALNLELLGQFSTDGSGNALANLLTGSVGDNRMWGQDGEDTLLGGAGNDTMRGNSGNDELRGGDGDDTVLGGSQDDLVYGDVGNDMVKGGRGVDSVEGGAGHDELFGNRHDDTLRGGEGNDVLRGGKDDDRLEGGSGADQLMGQSGADTLIGGSGNDTLIGGTGNDLFVFGNGSGADVIEDFRAGPTDVDVLDFSLLGIEFGDLSLVQQGASTRITTPGGDSVLLQDVLPGDLVIVDDFLF